MERLAGIQTTKLRRVLRYAWRRLPFYRERWRALGVHPDEVSGPEDLWRLPRTRKADLVETFRSRGDYRIGIEAVPHDRETNVVMTSGTLGFNTFCVYGRGALGGPRNGVRPHLRRYWMQQLRPGMKVLLLSPAWHFASLLDVRTLTLLGARAVIAWGTHMPRFVPNVVRALMATRPDYVVTIPPMLYHLMEFCRSHGLAVREVFRSVRYVTCIGEAMTPALRFHFTAELGVEHIFEGYGSSDGLFGFDECRAARGHHVFLDCWIAEVVDPVTGRPVPEGARGNVVVTSLSLGKSVYVRYDTEDVGAWVPGACPCGRTHPVLEVYDRRANAFRVAGRELLTYDIRVALDGIPGFVGAPFVVIRPGNDAECVELRVHRPSESNVSSDVLSELLAARLGVPVRVQWMTGLPVHWKGRVVDTEVGGRQLWPRD